MWFCPEANLGLEHHHLESMVNDIEDPPINIFYDKPGRPGVCKTEPVTKEYQFLLSNTLACAGLRFDRTLFTVTREKTPKCMMNMLMDQMLRFHYAKRPKTNELAEDRFKLTAKIGNQQDDLLIAVCMALYVMRLLRGQQQV